MPSPGWVYVLTNPTLPGLVKIGQTTHTASLRARQLEREYGAADAFEVASKHATPDAPAVEAIAHRMLADCRQPRSELFACTPKDAAAVIRAAVKSYEKPWALTIWLRRLLHPTPTVRKSTNTDFRIYRSRRRGSADGLAVVLLLAVLVAGVVAFRPAMPSWLPVSITRAAMALERMR